MKAYKQVATRIGNPLDEKILVGPMVDTLAVELFTSALKKVKEEGGKIIFGGEVLKGEEYEAGHNVRQRTLDDYLTYSFIALAAVAILMSVIGFVKHERLRPGIAGAALGGLAITFQFATMVFFGLLFAIVLAAVIDKLDFDF